MPSLFRNLLSVRIRDVTLRDGLQSLRAVLPTQSKIDIYNALVSAGISDLQITSFVNPSRVPQLEDAEALCGLLSERPERRSALVANLRGYERAVAVSAKEIEAVVSVSETYNRSNAHRTTRQSLDEIKSMAQRSPEAGCTLTVGLANCYHCVFEGTIVPAKVLAIVDELSGYGIAQIGLSDTTGYATPDQVYDLSRQSLKSFPQVIFGAHLHDTRGRGLANAMAALMAGILWFDAALAGLGGSPFAPGMGGNLSLETLADSMASMGVPTGVDVKKIFEVGRLVGTVVDRHSRGGPLNAAR
jgi:hydroxymethylglutaryl-CoA lyase